MIQNPNGLHVRPASKLVAALAGFNADLVLEKEGKCVTPDSLNQIALLQVRRNDTLLLLARGPDADAALAAFRALATENFGEQTEATPALQPTHAARIQGQVVLYPRPQNSVTREKSAAIGQQQLRLKRAIDRTLDDLSALTAPRRRSIPPTSRRSSPGIILCLMILIYIRQRAISCATSSAARSGRGIRC